MIVFCAISTKQQLLFFYFLRSVCEKHIKRPRKTARSSIIFIENAHHLYLVVREINAFLAWT